MGEALAILALAAALVAAALRRPPEALVALGGAALLLVTGTLGADAAEDEARSLGPTLALLAALLVLGDGCRRAGLFEALGHRIASAGRGRGTRLLALVFAAAVAVTAVLGLDATVVLLTPAVLAAAARSELDPRPHAYACNHLANSASVLLPISNLTNLLAFRATELSFARFALLMALPCAVAVAVEWAAIRAAFARVLTERGTDPGLLPGGDALHALLGAAALAALLANLLNNVPALLVLLPAAAAAGPVTVLAVLIGVNVGPNLTYTGSLATLLWRRVLHRHGEEAPLAEFTRLGLITVPLILVGSTAALWLAWGL